VPPPQGSLRGTPGRCPTRWVQRAEWLREKQLAQEIGELHAVRRRQPTQQAFLVGNVRDHGLVDELAALRRQLDETPPPIVRIRKSANETHLFEAV
jgi:hypothetical protein